MTIKYLDTYALIEISKGNPHFSHYLSQQFIILDLTLAEFYGVLLREDGERTADYWFKKLQPYSINTDQLTLIEAVKFRHQQKERNISFFDAVGYVYSLKNNYHFVTGDKEFENLKGVEFRK